MQCPGQDSRYWDGEAIFESKCPNCGAAVEFFKDDSKRKCRQCGHDVFNPKMDFGCASYCPYAEQCLGSMPPELLNKKQDLLIDRVAIEVKKLADGDFKRIGAATRMARQADTLAKAEEANRAVVMIAAYLAHLPAARGAERASAARDILGRLGANPGLTDEVCAIVEAVSTGTISPDDSLNSRVTADAAALAGLEEALKAGAASSGAENAYLTGAAGTIAVKMLSTKRSEES